MRELNCFIFDFDGTLAHSEPAYSKAFHHSVRMHTGLEISEDEIRGFWNVTPQEVLGRYGSEMLDEMMASFEEHYYANHHHYLTAYAGIVELLEELNARGARCAVVSLKPRRAGELEPQREGRTQRAAPFPHARLTRRRPAAPGDTPCRRRCG